MSLITVVETIKIDSNFVANKDFHEIIKEIYKNLSELEKEYPDFRHWFFEKVKKELELKARSRTIIIKRIASDIVGIAILKHTDTEKKICTLRVSEGFRRRGIGTSLMRESIETLKCPYPKITVSSLRFPEFSQLLKAFGFTLYKVYYGYYKKDDFEYSFNGSIETTHMNVPNSLEYSRYDCRFIQQESKSLTSLGYK